MTPFLIIGTLTWLVLVPPFIQKNPIARGFRKIWFLVSLPATALLAISVFVRVREYGLTPERIALILLVIWALIVPILFTFAKEARRDIRIIPGFAAMLLAGGALLAGTLSVNSQAARAKSNLKQAGIMEADGSLVSEAKRLISDKEAATRARGAIEYLIRNDADKQIAALFPDGKVPAENELFAYLGLNKIDSSIGSRSYLSYNGRERTFSIEDYAAMTGPFNVYNRTGENAHYGHTHESLKLNLKDYVLITKRDGEEIGRIDMKAWAGARSHDTSEIKVENPVLPLSNREDSPAIFIQNMNMGYDEEGELDHMNMDVYLLTRD